MTHPNLPSSAQNLMWDPGQVIHGDTYGEFLAEPSPKSRKRHRSSSSGRRRRRSRDRSRSRDRRSRSRRRGRRRSEERIRVSAAEEDTTYAYQISGFSNSKLDSLYVLKENQCINGQSTYWSKLAFMYIQLNGLWAISQRWDKRGQEMYQVLAGGVEKTPHAFQVSDADPFQWQEFVGSWKDVTLEVCEVSREQHAVLIGAAAERSAAPRQKASPAVPATPAVPPVPATPAVPPVPATPAVPPVPATPAVPPVPATPAVPPVPATPAVPPVPATPLPPIAPSSSAPQTPHLPASTSDAVPPLPTITEEHPEVKRKRVEQERKEAELKQKEADLDRRLHAEEQKQKDIHREEMARARREADRLREREAQDRKSELQDLQDQKRRNEENLAAAEIRSKIGKLMDLRSTHPERLYALEAELTTTLAKSLSKCGFQSESLERLATQSMQETRVRLDKLRREQLREAAEQQERFRKECEERRSRLQEQLSDTSEDWWRKKNDSWWSQTKQEGWGWRQRNGWWQSESWEKDQWQSGKGSKGGKGSSAAFDISSASLVKPQISVRQPAPNITAARTHQQDEDANHVKASSSNSLPHPVVSASSSGRKGFPPTLQGFYMFMIEREQIRIKRGRSDSWPWTDDLVMRCTRLSNVKREHDRTGMIVQRLLSQQAAAWERSSTDSERLRLARSYVFTVGTWRRFGSAEFIATLGFKKVPESEAAFDAFLEEILELAVAGWREGWHSCTDAYPPARACHNLELAAWLQEGAENLSDRRQALGAELKHARGKGAMPKDLQALCSQLASKAGAMYIRKVYNENLAKPLRELWEKSSDVAKVICDTPSSRSWRKCVESMWLVKGYAAGHGVHAAEVLRDLLATPLLTSCTDLDTWAPVSAHARRCLGRFSQGLLTEDASADVIQKELLEVYQQKKTLWPDEILQEPSVQLTLQDVQAQLGEFERYTKALNGNPERSVFFPRTGR